MTLVLWIVSLAVAMWQSSSLLLLRWQFLGRWTMLMKTICFSGKNWSTHEFHSRCLPDASRCLQRSPRCFPDASRCLQRSPRCLSDASRCFPGVVRPAGRLIQVNYLGSGFKQGDIYWIKSGWVVFLEKQKNTLPASNLTKKTKSNQKWPGKA